MCNNKDDNDNNNDDDDGGRWAARGRWQQMTLVSALAVSWWQRQLISNKHFPSHQPASICL